MKIALVHDHLISTGGAERTLKAFAEIWPEAPIYTLIFNPAKTNLFFSDKNIKTSYLQTLPLSTKKYQWYLPLRTGAFERMKFDGFDIVISDSSAHAKGVFTNPRTLHIIMPYIYDY